MPPTIVTTAKNQNVPLGLFPLSTTGSSMLGTARELPSRLAKCKVIASDVAKARIRRGNSSVLSRYYIEFQPSAYPKPER
jgi:hypothetical protein